MTFFKQQKTVIDDKEVWTLPDELDSKPYIIENFNEVMNLKIYDG
jgi:hypothetical protein